MPLMPPPTINTETSGLFLRAEKVSLRFMY
jgi:hypothetical protein